MTRRIRLTLEYDGSAYCGWQTQANGPSVQAQLELALQRLTGVPHAVTGASRTDAGVHALGQTAHFDTQSRIPAEKFCFALNTLLPPDIRVGASMEAPEGFHARYDALGKSYVYRILNRPHHGALQRNTHAHVPLPLDERAMDEAAALFVGVHDFRAFMAAGGSSKTFSRRIAFSGVRRRQEELLFTVTGSGFLYNMVRIMAGTLIEVGLGKRPKEDILRAYATGDRLCLGVTAPAQGLTLACVYYPGDVPSLPEEEPGPFLL